MQKTPVQENPKPPIPCGWGYQPTVASSCTVLFNAMQVIVSSACRTAARMPFLHITLSCMPWEAGKAVQGSTRIAVSTLLSAVLVVQMCVGSSWPTWLRTPLKHSLRQQGWHRPDIDPHTWQSCTSSGAVLSWPVPGGPQNFRSGLTNLAKCPRLHASTPS
jgi:hypothetical protein